MIKSLRRKFIVITMLSIFGVLAAIMMTINLLNITSVYKDTDDILGIISQNQGEFPKGSDWDAPRKGNWHRILSRETPYQTRFFSVTVDQNGNPINTDIRSISSVNEQQAKDYALSILKVNATKGNMDDYRYLVSNTKYGKMIIFMDCSDRFSYANSFMVASILISMAGLAFVFVLVVLISRKVVKPIAESYDKQKRFITDSSHEIKTPLAVINANVEVLEMENGQSEWTQSIKNQVNYLTKLASSLTSLVRMDEGSKIQKDKFSLSEAVNDTAEQFSTIAKIEGKTLNLNITDEIDYSGNEEMLRRLVSVLLDNAIKYSNDTIRMSLFKHKGKIFIECFNNTPEEIKENPNDYFDRFYRADSSRSKETGGFGIGLSIAKAIVEAHSGKISVRKENGKSIRFTVSL